MASHPNADSTTTPGRADPWPPMIGKDASGGFYLLMDAFGVTYGIEVIPPQKQYPTESSASKPWKKVRRPLMASG